MTRSNAMEGEAGVIEQDFDVLVIGGGPAGSTAATLLAGSGHRVALVERERHPRFHIGESLLPMSLPILERLGVLDEVARIGVRKRGADFPSASPEGYRVFRFARSLNPTGDHAFQVRRDEFDEVLFRRAATAGAVTFEGVEIRHVEVTEERVSAVGMGPAGERRFAARYMVDATGRDTLLGSQWRLKRRHATHRSAALFGHFSNVERRAGEDAGNISIYRLADGWIWVIPLRDGLTSIGMVCGPATFRDRSGDLAAFLLGQLHSVEKLAPRLKHARLVGHLEVTGNYSYACRQVTGPRWLMVGDAACFLDPVFSSGVHLALESAVRAAGAIDIALRTPVQAGVEWRRYAREHRDALRRISWLILRFNTPVMRRLFAAPRNDWRLEDALVSLLAGDFHRDGGIGWRFNVFRIIYALSCLQSPMVALRGWLARVGRRFQRFDVASSQGMGGKA